MLKKRIIICLDVKDGRTTKGVKFQNNIDIGDPVEMAAEYYRQNVDELVFYDIMASARGRGPILDLISRVASQVFIPFCVGGGIGTLEDIRSTIMAGAERVYINGGRVATELDAKEWALRAVELGAGEIVLNSIDADGTRDGYELNLTRMISQAVSVPVIASGGGGKPQHLVDVLTDANADAALIASMVHSGDYTVGGIKEELSKAGVPVR